MKIVTIIQARMGSTRLPGKIMKEVLGKPLLEYQIERVRRSKLIDQIVIATTTNESEQPIIDLCEQLTTDYYRGSEDDVLSRYYEAAVKFKADIVVRITSDCPIIDPVIIDNVIEYFNEGNFDYVSNGIISTFPRGMDAEVFSFKALEKAHLSTNVKVYREHVTPYIYKNNFKIANYNYEYDASDHRWTVDTQEDFNLIMEIIKELYPLDANFTMSDVLNLIARKPDLFHINSHIEQKKI